jgi:hypothetical protein
MKLKKTLPIILCLAFLLQSFSYILIWVNYTLNEDYIAKNLCENKFRPKMKCHGKCHMMKMMKAQEKNDNKGLPESKNIKQIVLYSTPCKAFAFAKIEDTTNNSGLYITGRSSTHKTAVFHPPLG